MLAGANQNLADPFSSRERTGHCSRLDELRPGQPRSEPATQSRDRLGGLRQKIAILACNRSQLFGACSSSHNKQTMAGAGGFEPPYGGIKIRCLTTWLRPNRLDRLTGRYSSGNTTAGAPSPYWYQDRGLSCARRSDRPDIVRSGQGSGAQP